MPDFIAESTLDTIHTIVQDLSNSTARLSVAVEAMKEQESGAEKAVTPQVFVSLVLELDEQLSRARLLLPLCTAAVQVNENGRLLSLSDLIMEVRGEFDTLARAQIEALVESSTGEEKIGF